MSEVLSQGFYLLAAHALTDYVLQPEYMARLKRPQGGTAEERSKYGPWWWWMLAHSLINGLGVSLALSSVAAGIYETCVHFWIDRSKTTGILTTNMDQLGHLLSKVLWLIVT